MKRDTRMTRLGWGLSAFFWLIFFLGRVLGLPVPLWLDLAGIAAGIAWLALEFRRWRRGRK